MSAFLFVGTLPASKSLMNRALIAQSFQPQINILGQSQAADVQHMREAINQFNQGLPIDCGSAGTVLRFMALRVARAPGLHILKGTPRLFERPQQELVKILGQLGCAVELEKDQMKIRSWGWKMVGDALHIATERSSQFASAAILSAWNLPFELCILLGPNAVSQGYLDMTLALVSRLGMKVDRRQNEIRIPREQRAAPQDLYAEPDLSSMFALAACAAIDGQISVTGMPHDSLQPDRVFVSLLETMGAKIESKPGHLDVHRTKVLKPISVDLTNAPDLFPVLAALAAVADGESFLSGAPQLVFKESNRVEKINELLKACGRVIKVDPDGIKIVGQRGPVVKKSFSFDPDQDHRLAFAAAVLKLAGEPIEILNPEVVNKSFPEFWRILRSGT